MYPDTPNSVALNENNFSALLYSDLRPNKQLLLNQLSPVAYFSRYDPKGARTSVRSPPRTKNINPVSPLKLSCKTPWLCRFMGEASRSFQGQALALGDVMAWRSRSHVPIEDNKVLYAVRIKANAVLERASAAPSGWRSSKKPEVHYESFSYPRGSGAERSSPRIR